MPFDEVVLITDANVCRNAVAALQNAVIAHPERLSGRAYVVKAGTRYVVYDPGWYHETPGDDVTIFIFDRRWRLLSRHV